MYFCRTKRRFFQVAGRDPVDQVAELGGNRFCGRMGLGSPLKVGLRFRKARVLSYLDGRPVIVGGIVSHFIFLSFPLDGAGALFGHRR